MSDVQTDAPVIDPAASMTPNTAPDAPALDPLYFAVSDLSAKIAPNVEIAFVDADETATNYALRLLPLIAAAAANEIAVLTAERDALQAAADKAAAAPKVSRASAGAEARKVGALENPAKDDLLAAIAAAETVEVVFSDGKLELLQIPALTVSGAAWASVIGGVALRVPELTVYGPAVGQNPWPLAGYGLFLDGKQAAWAPRPDTLIIGGGMQVNLRDDVIFPAE